MANYPWWKSREFLRLWNCNWEHLHSSLRSIQNGLCELHADIRKIRHELHEVKEMEVNIMATQADLDALVAQINTAVADIRQDIEDIKAAHPDLDLSGLEASVAGLTDLDNENPAPAPVEPPVDNGDGGDTPPVDDGGETPVEPTV